VTREERRAALQEAQGVLVSACLLGQACRYDGQSKGSSRVLQALEGKDVVPVCPESAAGLGTPRPAVVLRGGTGEAVLAGRAQAVERESGRYQTAAFRRGAELALEAARRFGTPVAVLKERSPSCGTQETYVGGQRVRGQGVTAALLHASGILTVSDEDL
jgi:uncharacterized protein YbbK (DUF523 family)